MLVAALFTQNDGQPATGLTLSDIALYLYSRKKADGTAATVWNGVNPTEEVGGGIYTKDYAAAQQTVYDYYGYAQYSGAETLDSNYSVMVNSSAEVAAADVWAYATRRLTQTASEIEDAITGDQISVRKHSTLSVSFTGLGNLATRTGLYFTLKRYATDADGDALIQVDESNGLKVIDAETAATPANGSITVTDEDAGDLTVTVAAAETGKLDAATSLIYDVKLITATAATVLTEGTAKITAVATRATS